MNHGIVINQMVRLFPALDRPLHPDVRGIVGRVVDVQIPYGDRLWYLVRFTVPGKQTTSAWFGGDELAEWERE